VGLTSRTGVDAIADADLALPLLAIGVTQRLLHGNGGTHR
jgi:hypothetical protein